MAQHAHEIRQCSLMTTYMKFKKGYFTNNIAIFKASQVLNEKSPLIHSHFKNKEHIFDDQNVKIQRQDRLFEKGVLGRNLC